MGISRGPPRPLAAAVRTDENAYDEVILPGNLLLEGTNVLAAEVHQAALSSSDLSFDLVLLGDASPPPPPVNHPPVAASANVITDEGVAVAITLHATDAHGLFPPAFQRGRRRSIRQSEIAHSLR